MLRPFSVALVALSAICSTTRAESFSFTVKVIDADKRPVAKADLGVSWTFDGDKKPSTYPKNVSTDADGKATVTIDDWNEKRPLLVLSADRKLGAIVGVGKEDDGKEVTVSLGPTVRVMGKLECSELSSKPKWANVQTTADGFRAGPAQHFTESGQINFVLPAGKYKFFIYGTNFVDFKQNVTLAADEAEHDLGTIDLKASPIAKMKGKAPVEPVIGDARGVNKEMKLSDFKGKWLYLEFWGYW
jgi:hypothetical protein